MAVPAEATVYPFPPRDGDADDGDHYSLARNEAIIRDGLRASFVAVGDALRRIHDKRQYRERNYPSFAAYCRSVWGMSRTYAYDLMGAAEVSAFADTSGLIAPESEGAARPLARFRRAKGWDALRVVLRGIEGKRNHAGPMTAAEVHREIADYETNGSEHTQEGDPDLESAVRSLREAGQALSVLASRDPAAAAEGLRVADELRTRFRSLAGDTSPAPNWSGLEVRQIESAIAAPWIEEYHYSGKPNPSSTAFGCFAPDLLAVVTIGQAANVHGVAKKFGLQKWPGNKEITRVACHPDAPKNAATRCIAAVTKVVAQRDRLDWLFSYADTGQGHHGGIYQGLNAVYVGTSAARPGWLLDGEPIHPRSIVAMFGTQDKREAPRIAVEHGHKLVEVDGLNTMKHLYILPIAVRKGTRDALKKHLQRHERPYPKRPEPGAKYGT